VLAELTVAAALICIDPGHGTAASVGGRVEPIGPGSSILKIRDGGGAAGEAAVALAIAQRTAALLRAQGYAVVLTRTTDGYRGGNADRAQVCNSRHAALMLRIHADGSTDPAQHGAATLVPALRQGWTDDIYASSGRAGRLVQSALVAATGAADRGIVERSDLTGFNWADVPAILVETGFLSNAAERARLQSAGYQQRLARGLAAGVRAFVGRPARAGR
jgi:N-acetylmuramoyl-L-alanine amidase